MIVDIALFSDTHTYHNQVILPDCDIAIFVGDMSDRGDRTQVYEFMNWFNKQHQATHKIVVAGNHDLCFDPDKMYGKTPEWLDDDMNHHTNLIYLCNSGVNLFGLNIWGSPVTPDFFPEYWAFNKPRGEKIREIWNKIPENTDILAVHGPARGLLDYVQPRDLRFESIYPVGNVGCVDLKDKILTLTQLKLMAVGHIHENNAVIDVDAGNRKFKYANVACCDHHNNFRQQPALVTLNL